MNPIPSQPSDGQNAVDFLRGIDDHWKSILLMEKQLLGLRNQLVQTQTALNALNRDLSGNDSLAASTKDRKDWQGARRWLREAATRISCAIRDHDIGPTSGAGRRDWFEQMHAYVVLNRQPVQNIAEVHQEFVNFRKLVSGLTKSLSSIDAGAKRDGINRANRVLNTIRSKSNKKRRKR